MEQKQFLTAILTGVLLIGCFAVSGFAVTVDKFGDDHRAYDERLYGDINLDWKLDATDYMMVKRAVLGTFPVSESNLRQTDINQNGKLDPIDYLMIKRAILGTIAPLGFAPPRELSIKRADSLTDEELYAEIDKDIAMAEIHNTTELVIRFQRITRETQAAEVLSSLGLPDDLNDKSVYTEYYWWDSIYGWTLEILFCVPPELSLRETMFKLYRCEEISDRIIFTGIKSPEA